MDQAELDVKRLHDQWRRAVAESRENPYNTDLASQENELFNQLALYTETHGWIGSKYDPFKGDQA